MCFVTVFLKHFQGFQARPALSLGQQMTLMGSALQSLACEAFRRCGWRCSSRPVNGSCRLVPARHPALGGCGSPQGHQGPFKEGAPSHRSCFHPLASAQASSGITLGSTGPVTPVGVTLLRRMLGVPRTARHVSCVLPGELRHRKLATLRAHVARGQVHWASCREAR